MAPFGEECKLQIAIAYPSGTGVMLISQKVERGENVRNLKGDPRD
jgi:hypothetical protein